MANNRIKKIGGNFTSDGFRKVVKQLNGRAVLVVTIMNKNCEECAKLQHFINQLENGFIDKLPQLVMLYGFNPTSLEVGNEMNKKETKTERNNEEEGKEKKQLSDTNVLNWSEIPGGHGYGIFLSETDVLYYKGDFDHEEYIPNIVDNIRRFKSSIKTLAGLNAKNQFLKKQRTGIIIETSGATQQSQIMDLEAAIKSHEGKMKAPVYFCKGINQELSFIVKGKIVYKQKGHNLTKFLKKVKKATLSS